MKNMFKVSFREKSTPSKVVLKSGRVTTVTYRGTVKLPKLWWYMPEEVRRWVNACTYVDMEESIAHNTVVLYSRGVSKCRDGDKYDTLLGERVAEARAKMHIYWFFYQICGKLIDYYNHLVYGDDQVVSFNRNGGLVGDMHRYQELYKKEQEYIEKLLSDGDK